MRRFQSALGRRLVLTTIAVSSVLALLVTVVQLLVEYRRDVEGIDSHFTIIGQSYLPSIEETVWLLDKQRLETLLSGIARLPDFRYAEVSTGGRRVAASGDRQASLLMREYALDREYRGKRIPMGTLTVGASLDAVRQRLWARAGLVLAGNAVKTGLVGLFMLLLIDRTVVRRIKRMAGQAGRYRDGKGWNALAGGVDEPSSRDEISELGIALDGMSARVDKLLGSLRQLNAELEQRVRERTRDLASARDEAERANLAKGEFLSSMSHELRTPLNAILGFGQLLEIDPTLDAAQRDQVDEILRGGRHLLALVNDVLDLARIEAGHVELSLDPVGIQSLLDDCGALTRPLMDERGIAFSLQVEEGSAVQADRTRLKQVLLNLLSNAIKYNRENGLVAVCAKPVGEGLLRISVQDTGPGIPDQRLGELFQAFNRLGAERSDVAGTGIGLAISRRLTQMMGGRLGVDTEPGQGSTFWLELPSATLPAPAGPSRRVGINALQSPAAPDRRILHVDDNPANLKLVSQLLAMRSDIGLLTAPNGSLGLELAHAHQPDLILLDIEMPGMDGYEMLRRLRSDERLKRVPVLAITASATAGDIARGRAAGFDEYLTKPIDVTRFLAAVDRLLVT